MFPGARSQTSLAAHQFETICRIDDEIRRVARREDVEKIPGPGHGNEQLADRAIALLRVLVVVLTLRLSARELGLADPREEHDLELESLDAVVGADLDSWRRDTVVLVEHLARDPGRPQRVERILGALVR